MLGLGAIIAGKYRVEQLLGHGGMGYVVSARHTQLDQRVAVKFMMPELCEHEEAVARFLREARAAVRIHGEHVARVLDVGTLDDGTPYMVMEFLLGRDLDSELEERGHLPVPVAVNFILQACEALAEAHALGIVHRDLKPANLFLTRRPDGSALIKVLDFGISKAMTDPSALAAESLTASQSLIGSPYYMSPEQVRRPKLVDRRSDIWALGVILFELLSGERPFAGDTPMSVLAAVVSDPAPGVCARRPELPPELEHIILRCLEKEPAGRFPSVAEFAQALSSFTPGGEAMVSRIVSISRAQPSSSDPAGAMGLSATTPQALTGQTLPSPMAALVPSQPTPGVPNTSTAFGHTSLKSKQRRFAPRGALVATLLVGFGGLMYALGRSGGERRELEQAQSGRSHSSLSERSLKTIVQSAEAPGSALLPSAAPAPAIVTPPPVASEAASGPQPVAPGAPARAAVSRLPHPASASNAKLPARAAKVAKATPAPSAAAPARPTDLLEERR